MLSKLAKLAGPVALLAGLFIVGSFLHPAKAAAATCTYNGQYVNTEIWVEIVKSDGTVVGWSNDFKFNVVAAANKPGNPSPDPNYPSQYWPQNDLPTAIRTSGGSPRGPSEALDASGHTHSCATPSNGSHPAYDFTDGSNGNYLLDCLGGDTHGTYQGVNWNNPEYSAKFTFTVTDPGMGYSFSDGVVQGGSKTWAPTTTNDLNFAGPLSHVFKFVLNDWTLTGTSTVSPSTVNSKTQVATFNHNIVNNGPDRANWKWRVEGCYQPAGQPACTSADYGPNINGGGGGAIGSGTEGIPGGIAVGGNGSLPKTVNYQFSFKSGSAAGDKYCQRIDFDGKNGPNTTPNYGAHSNPVCVTFQPSNSPGGSITPACDPGNATAHATANFSDADGSATYPLTGKLSSGVIVQSATVNATTGTVTLTGAPVVNGSATFTLSVKDVGPGATGTFTTTASVSCSGGGAGCPSLPNPQVAVSLPDQAPNTPAKSGATNTPGESYEQDTPQFKTKVTAITDKSPGIWGGSSTPPTQVSESYQSVVLDYTPYINNYSYDNNQPSVTYDSYYNATYWYTSSSPDYYTCPYGGSPSGSTCVYGAYSYYSCPSGGFLWGSTCYNYIGPATYNAATNTYSCSSGSYVFGSCYSTYSATLNYYCSPGSLSGTTCYYGGTAWYNWHKGGTNFNLTKNNTVDGQQMTPCYNRQFTVTTVTGDQTNLNDNENPTSVTGGGGTINVNFNYDGVHIPALGLRSNEPFRVNLNYNTTYSINGSVPYMVGCSATSGGVTVPGSTSPGSGTASVPNSSCSATVPPLQAGDRICGQYNVSPTGDSMTVNGSVVPPGGNGQTVTDNSCSGAVVNEPYARFYGSDVTAGGAFASGNNECGGSAMNLGTISAYERGVGAQSTGAGSQLAALSLGQISGFASAFLRSLAPTSPTGLSFANTTPGFGGNLGSTYQHCVPDYYGTLPAVHSPWAGSFAAPGGAYSYSGDLTLGPGTVPTGSNVSIYVNGDVYISGDITYQTSGWTVTGNTSNVPSLYIIATGSINISPSVSTLDGVYVAQNNTIHTCAAGAGSSNLYDATDLYNNCHSMLRINGSFIAQNIVLDRTYSSLRHSRAGEFPFAGSPPHTCDVSGGAFIDPQFDCSAEVFLLGLDTYLSEPAMSPSGGPKTGKFDAITSMSPIL